MNIQKIKVKFVSVFRKKTFILTGLLIIIVFLLSTLLLIINSSKSSQQTDKTWQIELIYNSNAKKLSLEKLTVINRKTVPDQRNALYSPYKLEVFGKDGNVIFQGKVHITEKILYSLFLSAPDSPLFLPTDIKSVIFVPYQKDASKITILKNNNAVLQLNLPKPAAVGIIESAQAQEQSVSCGPITTVFINDNYANTDQFKNDVSYLKNLYNITPPYNTSPSIFDFKEVDTRQDFGCATSGIASCINNLSGIIKSAGLRYFPNAQKFIVLVDNPNALTVDGGVAGLVNGIGGDVIIYTNYVYSGPGPTSGKPFAAASHELEGHAVGYLWDRYVSSDPNYAVIAPGEPLSNCSTNPEGESFWTDAGSTGVFQGCSNQGQYAPFPLTCQVVNNKNIISGGTSDTIMSAIGCSPNQFDQAEQAWITNNILPNYKACPIGAAVNVSPSTSISFNPTPQTVIVNDTVSLDIMLHPGTNEVSFTKLVINYDSNKLSISPAGPAICPAKPTDALCPNVLAFPVVLQGPIYSSGTISVTFSVGGSLQNVIRTSTKIATVTFQAIGSTNPGTTEVSVNLQQSQALSTASTDYFNQNVLSSANPATITITGPPSSSSSPTPIFSGVVFIDTNGNGIRDTGEAGYKGASVVDTWIYTDGSTNTNTDVTYNNGFTDGFYSLQAPQGSIYKSIKLTVPAGYVATTQNPVDLTGVTQNTTINFGIKLGNGNPTPTPSSAPTYNCVLDPTSCNSGKSAIQMCALKCIPN